MNLEERAKRLKTDIPAIFLSLKDKKTPFMAKAFASIAVAYALSPIDLIPDFIPVLGYVDDLIILPVLISLAIKLIPEETFQQYKDTANEMWQDGKMKRWYYAVPVIFIWFLLLGWIVKVMFF